MSIGTGVRQYLEEIKRRLDKLSKCMGEHDGTVEEYAHLRITWEELVGVANTLTEILEGDKNE